MAILRRCAVGLIALALAGCHEDPQVVAVQVFPSGGSLGITASGGDATGPNAAGGQGGNLLISGWQEVGAGESTNTPAAPVAPVAPTIGTTIASADLAADYPPGGSVGTILIPGSVVTSGAGATRTITSTFGDIVVSGTLSAADAAGVPQNIALFAPNGTVYVTGTVSVQNTDGTLDGDAAGSITITAQQIVVTGNLLAAGEDSVTGAGGAGGAVTLTTLTAGTGDVLFLFPGSIVTTGGKSVAPGTATGATGGAVTIQAGGVANVFGTITTDGGSIAGSGAATGGTGGAVTIAAKSEVDVVATVSMMGGAATGDTSTLGGTGGAFLTDSNVLTRVYGSITTQGGMATGTAGSVTGGTGGQITLGNTMTGTGALSLEVGRNTYTTSGGSGPALGGKAGTIRIQSEYSRVMMGSPLLARGGDCSGTTDGTGGNGNTVTLVNNSATHGGPVDESVYVLNTGTIDTSGGIPTGAGSGGSGGAISITASAHVQVLADVTTRGQDSLGTGGGAGGTGGAITITATPSAASASNVGDVLLEGPNVDTRGGTSAGAAGGGAGSVTVNATASASSSITSVSIYTCTGGGAAGAGDAGSGGTLTFTAAAGAVSFTIGAPANQTGDIDTSGGVASGSGKGGNAGSVSLSSTNGSLSLAMNQLTASGGSGSGAGGAAGTITLTANNSGNVVLSGTITANGGSNLNSTPAAGGMLKATAGAAGGSITSSAVITMTGGSPGAGALAGTGGGNGGTILLDVGSSTGAVTLATGSSILLDGGSANGAPAVAGSGGTVTMNTLDQAISITGSILARGGTGSGGGVGGTGGQVIANSDKNADGIGGDITLQAFSAIDVSGGAGTALGGSARNSVAGYAVNFDADRGIGDSADPDPATAGTVLNLGSITATGGGGSTPGADGQVRFDGKGVSTPDPIAGSINPPAAFVSD